MQGGITPWVALRRAGEKGASAGQSGVRLSAGPAAAPGPPGGGQPGAAGVTVDPYPLDVEFFGFGQQVCPGVLVEHRLAVGGAPAVLLPAVQPGVVERPSDVLGVGADRDGGVVQRRDGLQDPEGLDEGRELHAVGVVEGSPPETVMRPSGAHSMMAANPPGPGLPKQAPSVLMVTCVMAASPGLGAFAAGGVFRPFGAPRPPGVSGGIKPLFWPSVGGETGASG